MNEWKDGNLLLYLKRLYFFATKGFLVAAEYFIIISKIQQGTKVNVHTMGFEPRSLDLHPE